MQVWGKAYFPERNLIALSADPLLLHPTHYVGQKGYISDTEASLVVNECRQSTRARDDL